MNRKIICDVQAQPTYLYKQDDIRTLMIQASYAANDAPVTIYMKGNKATKSYYKGSFSAFMDDKLGLIATENITIGGRELIRTYSDANLMIRQDGTGNIYSEAVDSLNSGRTYTETDTPIEQTEDDRVAQLEEDSKALKILLGEEEEAK